MIVVVSIDEEELCSFLLTYGRGEGKVAGSSWSSCWAVVSWADDGGLSIRANGWWLASLSESLGGAGKAGVGPESSAALGTGHPGGGELPSSPVVGVASPSGVTSR
jgi:hypothetical protein